MTYDISFKDKNGNYVGDDWISYTSSTGNKVKALTGYYISNWNGERCENVACCLLRAINTLKRRIDSFFCAEDTASNEDTLAFLEKVYDNCKRYPDAAIEVI
ncbi:MAG: hypothetical protein LUD27_01810 [Clostridia bacterium]|nr:hypothetical protein [Clostridia bacterium]